jgi:hypothetical protein
MPEFEKTNKFLSEFSLLLMSFLLLFEWERDLSAELVGDKSLLICFNPVRIFYTDLPFFFFTNF